MTEYYDQKLKEGLYFQDFVAEKLYDMGLPIVSYQSTEFQNIVGENRNGIEIKYDSRWRETGNIYIEFAEKTNKDNIEFIASGILRNDNTWLWVIGDKTKIFLLSKKQLIFLYNSKRFKEITTDTSKAFLLPVKKVEEFYAITILEF